MWVMSMDDFVRDEYNRLLKENGRMGVQIETEKQVFEIVRLLHLDAPFEEKIGTVLKRIAFFCNPHRICVIKVADTLELKFEWRKEGVASAADYINGVSGGTFKTLWNTALAKKQEVVEFKKISSTAKGSMNYKYFEETGSEKIHAVPLVTVDGRLYGFFTIEDFDENQNIDISHFMNTFAYFMTSELVSHDLLTHMDFMTYHDVLTGVKNRNSMDEKINSLDVDSGKIGVVFTDLNALKETNDRDGHGAGDALLREMADALMEVFPDDSIFRAGGDEFVILVDHVVPEDFFSKVHHLQAKLEGNGTFSASLGFAVADSSETIEEAISQADKMMYVNKASYYQSHNRRAKSRTADKEMLMERDPVTGLLTMKAFCKFAEIMMRGILLNRSGCIVYFDIVNFKDINRRYGFDTGDELLRRVGELLKEEFPKRLVSRLSEDHYGVLLYQEERDKALKNLLKTVKTRLKDISIKIGVCNLLPTDKEAAVCCDKAKIAADFIKKDFSRTICIFDNTLNEEISLKQYVINHFEEALSKDWIHVFFQPIIRSCTGRICSGESLARWVDPKYGLLTPNVFINTLEEYHLIHKLDLFVVEKICREYRDHHKNKHLFVSVSFNLSRLDFDACDIFEEVDKIVRNYEVPRQMLHVEITESVLISSDAYVKEQIKRFHKAGYQVWMDDFGSGFSSLNVLKDYDFDTLKIDMAFLRNFNEKSRAIITSIVDMAKKLHINTVAEGVENEDQAAFLKGIGCDMQQGFLYSKPEDILSYNKFYEKCRGYGVEEEYLRDYYNQIGNINTLSMSRADFVNPVEKVSDAMDATGMTIAIFEYADQRFMERFANSEFLNTVYSINQITSDELQGYINSSSNPNVEKFRQHAEECTKVGDSVQMDFMIDGNYVSLAARLEAMSAGRKAFAVTIQNLSVSTEIAKLQNLDRTATTLYSMYDRVTLMNVKENHYDVVYNNEPGQFPNMGALRNNIRQVAEHRLFPEDKERYLLFINPDTVFNRIAESKNGVLTESFRMLDRGGNYIWKTITLLPMRGKEGIVVSLLQTAHSDVSQLSADAVISPENEDSKTVTEAALWKTVLKDTRVGMFWKDVNRRFLGANQQFLTYYGLNSVEDIYGKTDEDMGWHVNPDPFRSDEFRVLHNGESIIDVPGKCLVNGENRDIAATKRPIYEDGRIVGLFGYFIDVTKIIRADADLEENAFMDRLTGLMNRDGLRHVVKDYHDAFKICRQDFAYILIDFDNFHSYLDSYGIDIWNAVLKEAGKTLVRLFGIRCAIGRRDASSFAVIKQVADQAEVDELVLKIREELEKPHMVNGELFSFYVSIGAARMSETKADVEALRALAMERRNEVKKNKGM